MKSNRLFKLSIAFGLLFMVFSHLDIIKADVANNNTSVSENSTLNYYLTIHATMNGYYMKDDYSTYYFEPTLMNDYIYVEDKLPDGLEFVGFSPSQDGTIGAIHDTYIDYVCAGYVVDDTDDPSNLTGKWNAGHTEYTYHGLHYNAETRVVSFRIADLENGCHINVGIQTNTPSLGAGQTRVDFNNFASAIFSKIMTFSNPTNRYIGDGNETVYTVNFAYDLDPEEVELLNYPPSASYAEGETVSLPNDLFYIGHHFDGWTSNDVTITNGQFVMPNHNVTLMASFSTVQGHNVSYRIEGTVPDGYIVPSTKMYYPDVTVKIDSLTAGDVFNGYEFQGWETNDYAVGDSKRFVMPNSDVELVGHFVQKKYTVNYNFIKNHLPSNADSLLPSSEEYAAGEVVHLPTFSKEGDYVFAGWDYKDGFKMPARDITVNGYWQVYMGLYDPELSVEIVDPKTYYRPGDVVHFNIHLKNNTGLTFRVGLYSEIRLDSIPENNIYYYDISEDTTIPGYYYVSKNTNTITNLNVDLVYFSQEYSENKYDLVRKNYLQTVTVASSPKLFLCQKFADDNIDQYGIGNITFKISNSQYDYDVTLHKECTYIYLEPGTYHIKELLPMEQSVSVVLGLTDSNDSDFVIDDDNTKENVIIFINEMQPSYFIKSISAKLIEVVPACSNLNNGSIDPDNPEDPIDVEFDDDLNGI